MNTTSATETTSTRIQAEIAEDAFTPYARLEALSNAMWHAERATRATVANDREDGLTWEQIGDALGVSKQAAQQRYGQ